MKSVYMKNCCDNIMLINKCSLSTYLRQLIYLFSKLCLMMQQMQNDTGLTCVTPKL